MSPRLIMHIDVNSAFLSWQAAYNKQIGIEEDIRNIPAIVGGDISSRRGIVLAKSIPAKKLGIKTGESLFEARLKCKKLKVVPPNYDLYVKSSKAFRKILSEYSPKIEVFSIDECFMDYTGLDSYFGGPIKVAYDIKDRINRELGFTVNIGISSNKLLAKMAGELKKPNIVDTIFLGEVPKKLWPLPVSKLFMVGRQTKKKLEKIGIQTIGDLANSDYEFISKTLKSHGRLIYQYAWGKDSSDVKKNEEIPIKSIGNGSTIKFDVCDKQTAYLIILSLVETAANRLRQANMQTGLIYIGIKNGDFSYKSHQRKIYTPTDSTFEIYQIAKEVFDEIWDGTPLRQFTIRLCDISSSQFSQLSIFTKKNHQKNVALDRVVDRLRERYGKDLIKRGVFVNSDLNHMIGGVGSNDEYTMMSSLL
ncbi:DNA polymerase IV [Clostridiaceae bacterium M8S5]|nr:DNA polymerase IV [Clostridiaceae bacterium M8S5]